MKPLLFCLPVWFYYLSQQPEDIYINLWTKHMAIISKWNTCFKSFPVKTNWKHNRMLSIQFFKICYYSACPHICRNAGILNSHPVLQWRRYAPGAMQYELALQHLELTGGMLALPSQLSDVAIFTHVVWYTTLPHKMSLQASCCTLHAMLMAWGATFLQQPWQSTFPQGWYCRQGISFSSPSFAPGLSNTSCDVVQYCRISSIPQVVREKTPFHCHGRLLLSVGMTFFHRGTLHLCILSVSLIVLTLFVGF